MKTTLETIRSHRPCEPGWKKLLKAIGNPPLSTEVTLLQILDSNGLDDALWCLTRCWPCNVYMPIVLNIVESVEHLSPVARQCNAVHRRYLAGDATLEDLQTAAYAAADAACAAYAAADAANAANAAACAGRQQVEKVLREELSKQ